MLKRETVSMNAVHRLYPAHHRDRRHLSQFLPAGLIGPFETSLAGRIASRWGSKHLFYGLYGTALWRRIAIRFTAFDIKRRRPLESTGKIALIILFATAVAGIVGNRGKLLYSFIVTRSVRDKRTQNSTRISVFIQRNYSSPLIQRERTPRGSEIALSWEKPEKPDSYTRAGSIRRSDSFPSITRACERTINK